MNAGHRPAKIFALVVSLLLLIAAPASAQAMRQSKAAAAAPFKVLAFYTGRQKATPRT